MEMQEVYFTWLNSLKSANTYKKYRLSVQLYCDMVLNKRPWEITEEDLKQLRFSDTLNRFIKPLRDQDKRDSTIMGHLAAMRSLIKVVRRERIFPSIDFGTLVSDALSGDGLSKRDVEHHEAMSLEELHDMEQWLREKKYQSKDDPQLGIKYALLIDFMYKTAVRVTATFNITWKNFTLVNSPYGGDWAMLEVIDKGRKLNTKYLHEDYFLNLKKYFYHGNDEEKVFGELSPVTLRAYFNEYSEKIGRNLVIHSLKAGAATTLYAETHDLLLVRDFCDHESVKTTENYIHTQKNPNDSGTAILTSDYDYEKIDELSKEQLLMLIHSKPEIESAVYASGVRHKCLKR